jgi:hypothetical protein
VAAMFRNRELFVKVVAIAIVLAMGLAMVSALLNQ